jgi:hypothetical protein
MDGYNFGQKNLGNSTINNIIILVSFIIMVYILVQMIIVLNKPEFLYYTLAPMPIDLNQEKLSGIKNSNKLPNTFANEFTYSFWLYLRSVNQRSDEKDSYKTLFFRSEQKDSNLLLKANPIVYFDKNSNKLIIKVRTSDADKLSNNNSKIPQSFISDEFNEDKCYYSELVIDHIPLKRWINVVINVDYNRISLFKDGDLYQTVLINRNPDSNCNRYSSSRTVSATAGDIYVGKDISSNMIAPDALLSKIQFYNYSLRTPSDIKKIYDNGPIENQSFLQKIGLPNIGLRNPIYNIEDTCN